MGTSDQHVQWTSHDKSEHVLRGLRFFAPRRDSKIDQVVQAGQCYLSLVPAAYLSSPSYVLIAKQGLAKRSDVTPPRHTLLKDINIACFKGRPSEVGIRV